MNHLDLVKLTALMERTSGKSEIMVGLLDGPVATNHPDLEREHIREIPGSIGGACTQTKSAACMEPLWQVFCARRGVLMPLPSVPTAPCWCALFLQRHKEAASTCQAPPP